MSYKEKLKSIKTVEELFDFRDQLRMDNTRYSLLWKAEGNDPFSENLILCQESSYFIERVEAQIKYFEGVGKLLTSIET